MELVEEKWDQILDAVKNEYQIPDISFKTWIRPLKIDHLDVDTIYILTQENDSLGINFLKRKYEKLLKESIATVTGKEYQLEFVLP